MSADPPPKVTLLVPTFQRPQLLRQTLESVLAQDYQDMEILVSDNGSTDETPQLIERLTRDDGRVRFMRNEKTIRPFDHGQQRLWDARGKYFVVVCDDDLVNPGFVTGLVNAMEAHPEATVAIPRTETIDLDNGVLSSAYVPPWDVCPGDFFILDWAFRFHPCPLYTGVTFLADTALMRQMGRVHDFASGIHTDSWQIITLALRGPVVFARDSLFRYRIHGTSMNISAPVDHLRRAAVQLKAAIRTDPFFLESFRRLPKRMQKLLRQAFSHMAGNRYLYGLPHLPKHRIPLALLHYPWDAEYFNLIRSISAKVLGRKLARQHAPNRTKADAA